MTEQRSERFFYEKIKLVNIILILNSLTYLESIISCITLVRLDELGIQWRAELEWLWH